MPLLKQIDPPEHQEDESAHHAGFAGFAERAIGFLIPGFTLESALRKVREADVPRVGEFYADYSDLTPEEIAQTDAECDRLFKTSKPVSR